MIGLTNWVAGLKPRSTATERAPKQTAVSILCWPPQVTVLAGIFFFLPGVDASHVYVRAWVLGCFQSYQYPNLLEGADRASGQLRGDKERPFRGVTKSGRVWRKVLESDAQSVCQVLSLACG